MSYRKIGAYFAIRLITILVGLIAFVPSTSPPSFDRVTRSEEASVSVAGESCSAIFEPTASKRSWAEKRRLGYTTQYAFRRSYEKRITPVIDGRYKALVHSQFPELEGEHGQTTSITGIKIRKTSPGLEAPVAENVSLSLLEEISRKSVDFVIEVYRKRRPHWTPQFLEKLRRTAGESLRDSTYIVNQEGVGYNPNGEIRAALRLIRERDGVVPMEKYLGIEVDCGNLLKVEPGNFAVEKSVSEEAWPEVIIHLLGRAAREIEPDRKNHYLTYADKYSVPLYSALGFTPIPPSKIRRSAGVEFDKEGRILKDGILWTPMEASQETLDGLIALHVDRLIKRGHDPEQARALLDRQAEADTFRGLEMRRLRGYYRSEKTHGNSELEISRNDEGKTAVSLSFYNERSDLPLFILPTGGALKNGSSFSVMPFGTARYQNGILHVIQKTTDRSLDIQLITAPDLSFVRAVRVLGTERGRPVDVEVRF